MVSLTNCESQIDGVVAKVQIVSTGTRPIPTQAEQWVTFGIFGSNSVTFKITFRIFE